MLIYRQGGEQMRNSYEIAKFIEEKLKELNMKPAEYARRVGVTEVQYRDISAV